MDKITKNKMAMYKSLKTILASHQANWSSFPAFASAVNTFESRLAALEEAQYHQNLALVGISAVKHAKQEIVADKAYAISSAMVAYAVVNNNVELLNHMKIAKHMIRHASRDHVLVLLDRIITRATEFVGVLGDYGIAQSDIDELVALRNELDAQMNAPRNAIIDRKGQTSRIKSIVHELDAIVRFQLDKLIVILKDEHPDFFLDYSNARIIVDHRNRSTGSTEPEPEPPVDDGL